MTGTCQACEVRPVKHPVTSLCGACFMAVYRRLKRGEPWQEALEDRRRQVQRAARGWTSGAGKRVANL